MTTLKISLVGNTSPPTPSPMWKLKVIRENTNRQTTDVPGGVKR